MNGETTYKFDFGKFDWFNEGRKINRFEVEVNLWKLDNGEYEFSASGDVWNGNHSIVEAGGQILDKMNDYLKGNRLFDEIYSLWCAYHLNGLNAGTRKQTMALEKHDAEYVKLCESEGRTPDKSEFLACANNYGKACDYLKSLGLYYDRLTEDEVLNSSKKSRNHYAYGTGWVTWRLPENVPERVKNLLKLADELKIDVKKKEF